MGKSRAYLTAAAFNLVFMLRLLDLLIKDYTFNSLENHAIKTGTLHNERVSNREVAIAVSCSS